MVIIVCRDVPCALMETTGYICHSDRIKCSRVIAEGVEDRLRRLRLPVGNRRVRRCSLAFIAYEPSEWEEEWRTKAEDYQQHTCQKMLEQKHLVDAWMEPMRAAFMPGSAAATAPAFQDAKAGILHMMLLRAIAHARLRGMVLRAGTAPAARHPCATTGTA